MKLLVVPFLLASVQTHPVAEVDSIVRSGVTGGIYPSAVVVIGTADTVLLSRGYGHLTWAASAAIPSPDSTLYDLASLSKVVATTPAIMRLVDRGLVDLDRPVGAYLADFRGEGKEDVTVRHLLGHQSGLRAFLPLNTRAESAAEARHLVVSEPLRWRPGSRVEYSDLNAMLLGWIVESASGMPLDSFVQREVTGPLRMVNSRYKLPRSERGRAAPINVWRGHPIAGVVHDQNAERLGGVAGHAGLYSTGSDLARYAQMYLSGGLTPDSSVFVREATSEEFTRRGRGNRALGWEMNDTTSTDNTGSQLSASAFGHGGYTGTSIWIDPELGLFVVLLTNRVYNPRTGRSITKLKRVRAGLGDAAVRLKNRSCRMLAIAGREKPGC